MISIPQDAHGAAGRCPECRSELTVKITAPLGEMPCPHCAQRLWYISLRSATRFFRPAEAAPIQQRVVDIVARQLCVRPDQVRADWTCLSELGADSLEVIEIMIQVEEDLEGVLQR